VFGFLKTKATVIVAPVNGKVVALEEVNDEVFSQKLAGEGIAIIPNDELFRAPIRGKLTRIFPTNHAFVIRSGSGFDLLVHIGLDTVKLQGEGFERVIEEGTMVEAGDAIMRVDLPCLQKYGIDCTTPIVITDTKKIKTIEKRAGTVRSGDTIMEVF
jgi:PTS system glucose-specific IIA component